MKAETASPKASRPIVVWEKRGEQQAGNLIAFPKSKDGHRSREQEATATRWEVGSATHPAVVTEVSSGFARKGTSVSSPQALHMRMAA
jgi:hypothetical protein